MKMVDDRKAVFPLGQVLCESFVGFVGGGAEVDVVVADLKVQAEDVDEGDVGGC